MFQAAKRKIPQALLPGDQRPLARRAPSGDSTETATASAVLGGGFDDQSAFYQSSPKGIPTATGDKLTKKREMCQRHKAAEDENQLAEEFKANRRKT
jgi:hypothetical protein